MSDEDWKEFIKKEMGKSIEYNMHKDKKPKEVTGMKLKNKVAIITGGSRGIGAAAVALFAGMLIGFALGVACT